MENKGGPGAMENAWNKFLFTGSVQDYLDYTKYRSEETLIQSAGKGVAPQYAANDTGNRHQGENGGK